MWVFSWNHAMKGNYIRMVELEEYLNLPISTLSVNTISEGSKNFLESELLPSSLLSDFPNVTISATTQQLPYLKFAMNVRFYVFAHLN